MGKTTGQVVDECSQTFLGIFLRQQQDHVLIAFDFTAHQTHHLLTQIRHFTGQIVQRFERDLHTHRGFQRLSRSSVMAAADGVKSHQVAS